MSIQEEQKDKLKSPRSETHSFLKEFAQIEPQANDEYKAYSFGRVGSRTQAMITFVKSDGYREALSYANLNRVWSADPEREIKLEFGTRHVMIEGSKLRELFNYVCANRCVEIAEKTELNQMASDATETIVTRLQIGK